MRGFKIHVFWMLGILAVAMLWGSHLAWGETTSIRLSTVPFIGEAPVYVAYEKGFFRDEGLDVTLAFNQAGFQSLQDLFNGKADIITVAQTPIVYNSFNRNDFSILASIEHSDKIDLVLARKDHGIQSATDLKGKKIAIFQKTTSDFLIDSFLVANGLKRSEVDIVNMEPPEMLAAIQNGSIDAMSCWQPHILHAQKLLGDDAIILPTKNLFTGSWLLIAMKEYTTKHPEIIERFLGAMVKAEQFLRANKEEAIHIHSKLSGADRDILAALWNDVIFDLSLDETLLVNLEDQARWAIRYQYTDKTEVPNYFEFIYFPGLETVKPEAVTVIK